MLSGVCHIPLVNLLKMSRLLKMANLLTVMNLLKVSHLLIALDEPWVSPHLHGVPLVQNQTVSGLGWAVGVATWISLKGAVRTERLADYLDVRFS